MQLLEVSGAVRLIYRSLGVKGLMWSVRFANRYLNSFFQLSFWLITLQVIYFFEGNLVKRKAVITLSTCGAPRNSALRPWLCRKQFVNQNTKKKFQCASDIITPSYSQSKTTQLQFLLQYTHLHIVSTLAFSIPISASEYFTKL